MIIRIWNNDGNDYCDYEAETIEEIREMCKDRIYNYQLGKMVILK